VRDLSALFRPRSVALVGASSDPMKWGGWFAKSLNAQPGAPPLHLVSRRGGEILGRTAVPSLRDLAAERPELVVLTVPAAAVPDAVDDALAVGARAIVVIAAGFGEGGEEGARRQRALVERVRAAGAVLVGPNCLGLFDAAGGVNATGGPHRAGAVGLASQSGNLALEIGMLLEAEGLGFSRFVSVGNQADVTLVDVLASCVDDPATRVAACYVEDTLDGRAFVAAVRALAEVGKPTLVLPAGRSERGAAAARSHTGALAGSARVTAAAVRDAGGILLRSPAELVERAKALLGAPRLAGRRVAVLADGGGHGVLAADLLADAGFELPALAEGTAARIAPELPNSRPANPVDLAGAGEMDVGSFGRLTRALLDAREVDAVLFSGFYGGYSEYAEETARREVEVSGEIADAVAASGKPVLVHSMLVPSRPPGIEALRARGVPTYGRVEDAIAGLDALLPRPPAPVAARAGTGPARSRLGPAPAYPEARALLAAAGITFPPGELARDEVEVEAAAARVGVPVALKAVSAALLHKTDAGGVVLGLATPRAAAAAASELRARVRAARPDLELDGIWVERMEPPAGVDLVLGARRDPAFGPVVLVGVGGIFVEVLDDVVIALAPADPARLAGLLRGLRAWPLLAGARGGEPVDVAAVARAAAALGDVLAADDAIAEVEVNPARARADGLVALDARVVVR
jgi:acyl-CoA synthetase (NDP forming)